MIITIARECGCDGDKIGEKLAEHFSIIRKKFRRLQRKVMRLGDFRHFSERKRRAIS